jgi:hypothetical protein
LDLLGLLGLIIIGSGLYPFIGRQANKIARVYAEAIFTNEMNDFQGGVMIPYPLPGLSSILIVEVKKLEADGPYVRGIRCVHSANSFYRISCNVFGV